MEWSNPIIGLKKLTLSDFAYNPILLNFENNGPFLPFSIDGEI